MLTVAKALRMLACLAWLGVCACARGNALVRVPDWIVHIDAELSPTPPPGMDGPVPTELRIYQLGSLGAFEAATYEQLHDDDKAVLGESLVARHADRIVLYPARSWQGELEIDPAARYVVVIAFLHQSVGRSWTFVAALPPAPSPGSMVPPERLAARPSGYAVIVGPDRVAGRPLFSPVAAPPPKRQRRTPRAPSVPTVPTIPQPPSSPALPTTPHPPSSPALPTTPQPPSPALPTAPSPPAPPRLPSASTRS
ncbi:type VI secretion system lipoprotein TssJ [Nannocystis sp. SCPEA4]|uniref:type VI secretion system lipoprotein TssJ n=1 Tax=Nannocystis sp. SCPEA4 TaxID=2996787 RepID=UPI002271ACE5|nr:type VI secretion system lipoprotein TssJ [Nannocystis sp. SCPEA4]MCY1060186.1 type VI secretion system lipoprotein TssJ [Nannocystis sp. SCPEA4]